MKTVRVEPINIQQNVFPLFAAKGREKIFAGTAFFVSHNEEVFVVSASHVVEPFKGYEFVAVPFDRETKSEIPCFLIKLVNRANFDLCIFKPVSHPPEVGLKISPDLIKLNNIPLYLYEFSTTEFKDNNHYINPATRIGNCVRQLDESEMYGDAGADMLELSIPALRGASGAPVLEIQKTDLIVHGIVIANSERHLLPAHIESILDQDNTLYEEHKYFLPQGLAVNSVHLLTILNDIDVSYAEA